GVGDPERMMVAREHGLEPDRGLANLFPVKPRPLVEGLVIGRDSGHQARDFRDIRGTRGPRFKCHRQGTSPIFRHCYLSDAVADAVADVVVAPATKAERAASNSRAGLLSLTQSY